MLDKPEFDCNDLGAFYDCGCADDKDEDKDLKEPPVNRASGENEDSLAHDHLAVEISKEAYAFEPNPS